MANAGQSQPSGRTTTSVNAERIAGLALQVECEAMVRGLHAVQVNERWLAESPQDEVRGMIAVKVANRECTPAATLTEAEALGSVSEAKLAAVIVRCHPLWSSALIIALKAAPVVTMSDERVVPSVAVKVKERDAPGQLFDGGVARDDVQSASGIGSVSGQGSDRPKLRSG